VPLLEIQLKQTRPQKLNGREEEYDIRKNNRRCRAISRLPPNRGDWRFAQRLKERGYEVYAVNPNATEIAGWKCYPNLSAIPGGVEAVVIGTRPEHGETTMQEVVRLGVPIVWMHRAFDQGSVSETATKYGREHGVLVIDGGCPLMFGKTSDGGHRFMCWFLTLTGKVPKTVLA
jgi:uncharacterized protein